MYQSVEFGWNPDEFSFLLESCKYDDGVQLSLKYLPDKNLKTLEAGCGSGRVVKYLGDLGYKNVSGIELNAEIVRIQNNRYPELKIYQGDILNIQYEDDSFDVVLCYGVVEHFPNGLEAPLHSIFQILKPGGIAVVTVPSLNTLRRFKHFFNKHFRFLSLKENNYVRKLFNKPSLPAKRNADGYLYYVYPQFGDFFEYRLKPKEFEDVCINAGFEILESTPISHIDGLYHESGFIFRKFFLRFSNWSFQVSQPADYINDLLKKIEFFHNHMHACVLRKPGF